ncbi:MAG: hypothetical protein JO002_04215 [Burkholderiaceae bacterium]|nr:hypothetical protein [Burkholderiaceae bacterium]
MRFYVLPLIFHISLAIAPAFCSAATPSDYIEDFSCEGGRLGLRLPATLPGLMRIGKLNKTEILEVEHWDGYVTERKDLYFEGLTLGIISFSNEPDRYMIRFSEIRNKKWLELSPFKVGQKPKEVIDVLGINNERIQLEKAYGSESGEVSFSFRDGRLSRINYSCYTG